MEQAIAPSSAGPTQHTPSQNTPPTATTTTAIREDAPSRAQRRDTSRDERCQPADEARHQTAPRAAPTFAATMRTRSSSSKLSTPHRKENSRLRRRHSSRKTVAQIIMSMDAAGSIGPSGVPLLHWKIHSAAPATAGNTSALVTAVVVIAANRRGANGPPKLEQQ